MEYLLHLLVIISIYAVLASSLDIAVGHMGVLSVAHAAFYGIGAYASAIAILSLGASFVLAVPFAVIVAVVLCAIVGLPAANLRDDSLVIATLCVQVVVSSLFVNWQDLTHGAQGIRGIPPPAILGVTFAGPGRFAVVSCLVALFAITLTNRAATSPLGRLLRAIREDEVTVLSAGKRPAKVKVVVLCFSAGLAALAGSLFASYSGYVSPASFGLMESVLILSMVIIGGPGRPFGPLAGAALLVLFPEVLRFVGLPASVAAQVRQVLYGVLLVVVTVARGGRGFSSTKVSPG